MTTRSSGPGASVTNVSTTLLPSGANVNNVPGGVKAECSNCGATHTPLWHRGLNNELNCNACGLYCKLVCAPPYEDLIIAS
jgi:GATA-binding protein